MKYYKSWVLIISVIMLVSCVEKEEKTATTSQNEAVKLPKNTLTVIGSNINLLSEPSSGRPLGQAQKGEVYEVFDSTAAFETVGRETDFWYQVEKMSEKVWIFGAFTSKNLNDNPKISNMKFEGLSPNDSTLRFIAEGNTEQFVLDVPTIEGNDSGLNLTDNPASYRGQTFLVKWKVKLKEIPESEGNSEKVLREVPFVIQIKKGE